MGRMGVPAATGPQHPPAVSVVVPTFNRANLLPRALASVAAQTYRDLELIVVDDHSSDRTPEVIAGFAGGAGGAAVRTVRHERNRGHSAALNTGIAAARGRYVAFLDDDDAWLPTKLAAQVAVLDRAPPEVGLVYGWVRAIDESAGGAARTVRYAFRGDIRERMLELRLPVPPSSWLVRTEAARSVGGFDEGIWANDVDFLVRLVQRDWRVDHVPEVVLLRHLHGEGQMVDETPENLARRAAYIRGHLDRFRADLRERPMARARVHLQLAVYRMRYRRALALWSVGAAFWYALLADPRKLAANGGLYARWLVDRLRAARAPRR